MSSDVLLLNLDGMLGWSDLSSKLKRVAFASWERPWGDSSEQQIDIILEIKSKHSTYRLGCCEQERGSVELEIVSANSKWEDLGQIGSCEH